MSIKDELLVDFQKAFGAEDGGIPPRFPEEFALWAAKWMGERLRWEILDSKDVTYASTKIRELTEELSS